MTPSHALLSTCAICGERSEQELVHTQEMMFGTRKPFVYAECGRCGALVLRDIPADMSPHYPAGYYSLGVGEQAAPEPLSALSRSLRDFALRAPARVVFPIVELNALPLWFTWIAGLGLTVTSRIGDLGSGGGGTLREMYRWGFSDLSGFDPFLDANTQLAAGLRLVRGDVGAIGGLFDLIMLNHSFEHMSEPQRVLSELREHVGADGAVLIRVPVADSTAYATYRKDWVSLDPPRHLQIFTDRSIALMARRSDFVVARSWRDSWSLQFWGSEQYRAGIPLRDPRSWAENPDRSIFTRRAELVQRLRSKYLNARGRGDSACYVLRPA